MRHRPKSNQPWPGYRRLGLMAAAVLCAAGLSALVKESPVSAQGQANTPAASALPPDLALVPPDAFGFVHVRVADLFNSVVGQKVRQQMAKELAPVNQECKKRLGVTPEEIDRLTLMMRSPKEEYPLVAVATVKPYDRQALLAVALPEHEEHKQKGKTYYTSKKAGRAALHFIDDRVFLHGMVEDVVQHLLRAPRANGQSPLTPALKLAAQKHHFVGGLTVPPEEIAEIKAELA